MLFQEAVLIRVGNVGFTTKQAQSGMSEINMPAARGGTSPWQCRLRQHRFRHQQIPATYPSARTQHHAPAEDTKFKFPWLRISVCGGHKAQQRQHKRWLTRARPRAICSSTRRVCRASADRASRGGGALRRFYMWEDLIAVLVINTTLRPTIL